MSITRSRLSMARRAGSAASRPRRDRIAQVDGPGGDQDQLRRRLDAAEGLVEQLDQAVAAVPLDQGQLLHQVLQQGRPTPGRPCTADAAAVAPR